MTELWENAWKSNKKVIFEKLEYEEDLLTNPDIFIQVVDYLMPSMTKKNEFEKDWKDAEQNIWGVITSSDLAFCITFLAGNYDHWKQKVEYTCEEKGNLPTGALRAPKKYGGNKCVEERKDYIIMKDKYDDELEELVEMEYATSAETGDPVLVTREEYLAIMYRKHWNQKNSNKAEKKNVERDAGSDHTGILTPEARAKIEEEEKLKKRRTERESWDFRSKRIKVIAV